MRKKLGSARDLVILSVAKAVSNDMLSVMGDAMLVHGRKHRLSISEQDCIASAIAIRIAASAVAVIRSSDPEDILQLMREEMNGKDFRELSSAIRVEHQKLIDEHMKGKRK